MSNLDAFICSLCSLLESPPQLLSCAIEFHKMTSTLSRIEDYVAQHECFYAAYPMNGTFPFSVRPLARDSALRLALPNFVDRVADIISSYGSITLIRSSAAEREVVTTDRITRAESLCLIVTGANHAHYAQAVREVYEHVSNHMGHHPSNVEIWNGLVILFRRVRELIKHRTGDELLSVGFYSSVWHRHKIVLSVCVMNLATHDWVELRARLADVLAPEVVVMFVPFKETGEMTSL